MLYILWSSQYQQSNHQNALQGYKERFKFRSSKWHCFWESNSVDLIIVVLNNSKRVFLPDLVQVGSNGLTLIFFIGPDFDFFLWSYLDHFSPGVIPKELLREVLGTYEDNLVESMDDPVAKANMKNELRWNSYNYSLMLLKEKNNYSIPIGLSWPLTKSPPFWELRHPTLLSL